jgi:hypothetical protein
VLDSCNSEDFSKISYLIDSFCKILKDFDKSIPKTFRDQFANRVSFFYWKYISYLKSKNASDIILERNFQTDDVSVYSLGDDFIPSFMD